MAEMYWGVEWDNESTDETCVLLSQKAPDAEIKVRLDMSELDITSAESKAKVPQVTDVKREAKRKKAMWKENIDMKKKIAGMEKEM